MPMCADIACQKEIDNLTLCRGMNAAGANKNACASQEDAVLECRGSFLCPAVLQILQNMTSIRLMCALLRWK